MGRMLGKAANNGKEGRVVRNSARTGQRRCFWGSGLAKASPLRIRCGLASEPFVRRVYSCRCACVRACMCVWCVAIRAKKSSGIGVVWAIDVQEALSVRGGDRFGTAVNGLSADYDWWMLRRTRSRVSEGQNGTDRGERRWEESGGLPLQASWARGREG